MINLSKDTLRRTIAVLLLCSSAALLLYVLLGRGSAPFATKPAEAPGERDWYAARDWAEGGEKALNISLFVFRDRNRNGMYDLGDLPMASVAVVLTRPDGSERVERSNINGYTNFSMRYQGVDADITLPDQRYTFEVQIPPGWQSSSGNGKQSAVFRHLAGSVAGLIADPPPAVVGLMPELSISGSVPQERAQYLSVTALSPKQLSQSVELETGGNFKLQAVPGRWRIEVTDGSTGALAVREFDVVDAPVTLALVDPATAQPAAGERGIVQNFDHLARAAIDKLPMGDHELGWDFLLAVDNQLYRGPGYVNTLSSGHAVGYNSSGHPVSVMSAIPGQRFDFVGAYFGSAWPQAQGEILTVEAWRGSQRIARDEITLSYLGPQWFQADYRDIDRLRLTSSHYWQFVTDDMHFRLPNTAEKSATPVIFSEIPDLSQQGNNFAFPDDGKMLCGAVAASNALAWLSGDTKPEDQRRLVQTLASEGYMSIDPQEGIGPAGFVRGIERYATERWGAYRRLEYGGWRNVPQRYRVAARPHPSWLLDALGERGAVWLNIGWYQREGDSLSRQSGHWVTLTGFDGVHWLVNDPGPWAGEQGQSQRVRFSALEQGVLQETHRGHVTSVAAAGYFTIDQGLKRPDETATAVLDGAVILVLN